MAKAYKNKDELLNTNWQSKIDNASSDAERAMYESARNDKIASQEYQDWGGKQQQTHNWTPAPAEPNWDDVWGIIDPNPPVDYGGGSNYQPDFSVSNNAPAPPPKSANDYLSQSGGDYSLAYRYADEAGADPMTLVQLQAGHAAKVATKYKGKDPYKGSYDIYKAPGTLDMGLSGGTPDPMTKPRKKYYAKGAARDPVRMGWLKGGDHIAPGSRVAMGEWTYEADENGNFTSRRHDGGASANTVLPIDPSIINQSEAHRRAYEAMARGDMDAMGDALKDITWENNVYTGSDPGVWADDKGEATRYQRQLELMFGPGMGNFFRNKYDQVYGVGAWDDPNHTYANQEIDPMYSKFMNDNPNLGLPQAPFGGNLPGYDPKIHGFQLAPDEFQVAGMGGNRFDTLPPAIGGFGGGMGGRPGGMGGYGGMGGFSPFEFGAAPQYDGSRWDAALESLANKLAGMSYENWTQGDQYKALADRYGQQGKLGMMDVLGQVASRTGGLASSYATTAAQQKENDYLSDLEEVARKMYGADMNDLYDQLKYTQGMAQEDYDRYLDQYNQWADNRNMAYGAWRDSVEDQRWQDQWNRDESRYQDELRLNQDALNREQAEAYAEQMAQFGDFSGYKALGFSDEDIAKMTSGYQAQLAAENAKKSRSSGSGGGKSNPVYDDDYDGLFSAAWASRNPENFIDGHYKEYGFKSKAGLLDEFETYMGGKSDSGTPLRGGDLKEPGTGKVIGQVNFNGIVKWANDLLKTYKGDQDRLFNTLMKNGHTPEEIDQIFAAMGL